MSKRAIMVSLVICLIIGGVGVSVLGYLWFTKNNPAVGVYYMEFPDGTRFSEGVKDIEKVMESDLAVTRVVRDLDLVNHYEAASEEEAAVIVRDRLKVNKGKGTGQVNVLYLDRDFEFSKEVLNAVHREFVRTREARAVLQEVPSGPGI